MKYTAGRMTIRLSALALIAFTAGLTVGRAGILEPTTTLPPPDGVYDLPLVCIAPVCLVNAQVSGFQVTSDVVSGGNELVSTNAVFSADIFQNSGGSPGAALGPLSIPGTMEFEYFGRSLPSSLGSFDAQITGFDFAGTFNTHPFEVMQNPGLPSLGMTTIIRTDDPVHFVDLPYQVTSFFDVFAELSLNNGPFTPGPERHTTLTGTPEPGSAGPAVLGLLSLAGIASRGRRRMR